MKSITIIFRQSLWEHYSWTGFLKKGDIIFQKQKVVILGEIQENKTIANQKFDN